jgi:hypothetical protein
MNNEAPESGVSKKVSIKNILSVLCIIFLLTTLLFAYLYYSTINDTTTNDKENPERVESTNPLPEGDLLNIDELMLSLSKILIPVPEEVEIEDGYFTYNIDMFGFSLNDTQYQKLIDFFEEETKPSESSGMYNYKKLPYETEEWVYFDGEQATDIYTKSGYFCITNESENPSSIVCFYAKDLSKNTKEYVSPFLESLIKDANLPCQKNECQIQLTEGYSFPLPNYSRGVYYSEEISDDQKVKAEDKIKEDVQKINLLFSERKWNSTIEYNTDIATKDWDENALLNLKKCNSVTASNDYLTCNYSLALFEGSNNIIHLIGCHYNEDALFKYQKEIDSILTTN